MAVLTDGNVWKACRCVFRSNKSDQAVTTIPGVNAVETAVRTGYRQKVKSKTMLHLEFRPRSKSL